MTPKKRGLGKGLDALLGTSQMARQRQWQDDQPKPEQNQPQLAEEALTPTDNSLLMLPVNALHPGKYQPRRDMSQEALEELAHSIRAQGVIQPIVVRPIGSQQYEIIAGERRWRACQLVQMTQVPCLVKTIDDHAAVAIALIENIQREDLNAIEEAVALERLLTEFNLSHQEVADAVGKSRSAVSNLLRLNQLNAEVKILVEHGDLDMGHARALLALEGEQQSETAKLVVQKGLTVRETEKWVQKLLNPVAKSDPAVPPSEQQAWSEQLADKVGLPVQFVSTGKEKGKIVLKFNGNEEFEKIRQFFGLI